MCRPGAGENVALGRSFIQGPGREGRPPGKAHGKTAKGKHASPWGDALSRQQAAKARRAAWKVPPENRESGSNTNACNVSAFDCRVKVIAETLGVSRQLVSHWLTKDISTAKIGNTYIPNAKVKVPPEHRPIILQRLDAGETQEQVAAGKPGSPHKSLGVPGLLVQYFGDYP